ncbi:MAG: hypothetical protein IKN27_00625 [Selenomonadaceae bacterium]|nr:hypothetical protein [Selenomonadaceae bacterium]
MPKLTRAHVAKLVKLHVVKFADWHMDDETYFRTGFICPICGEDEGRFDVDGKFFCCMCDNDKYDNQRLSPLDLFIIARKLHSKSDNDIVDKMKKEFGRRFVEEIAGERHIPQIDATSPDNQSKQAVDSETTRADFLPAIFEGDASDVDFAQRLLKFCGHETRWLRDSESWLTFERNEFGGAVWTRGASNAAILPSAMQMSALLADNASTDSERKIAAAFKNARKILSAINLFKGCESIRIEQKDLDKHGELLNVLNGVINLETGELLPAAPELLLSQQVNAVYDANVDTTFVENFFAQILPDETTRRGLLRWLGYSITSETSEEKFMLWHGRGRNGKGTISKTLLILLNSYATGLPTTALLKNNRPTDSNSATTALNSLEGARFAISEELPQGAILDSALTKNLIGGDKINLRRNYSEFRTIENHAKINLSGNFVPRFENSHDKGLIPKLLVTPFEQSFVDAPDLNLKKKLASPENLSALLKILVAEAQAWYRDGLIISPQMSAAAKKNLRDSDFIGDFLTDAFKIEDGLSTPAKMVIDKLNAEYPRECSNLKRADLIQMIVDAGQGKITYAVDRENRRVFKGIGTNNQDDFDGEIVSSDDMPPN